jgi:hypothetical protein
LKIKYLEEIMTKRVLIVAIIAVVFTSMLACGFTEQMAEPTPIPPTETPLLSPTPEPESFPGWEKFTGGGIEFLLPESFEGGDISTDLDQILEVIDGLGPDFQQFGQIIAQNPGIFIIYAFDTVPSERGMLANVNVTVNQTEPGIQVEDFSAAVISQLPELMTVTNTELLTINGHEAGKIELAYALEGVNIAQVMFVIKEDVNFWAVTYTTGDVEYVEMLPVFEQSISTFTVNE